MESLQGPVNRGTSLWLLAVLMLALGAPYAAAQGDTVGNLATHAAYAASGAWGLVFARRFLFSQTPTLDRLLLAQAWAWTVSALAALYMPPVPIGWTVTALAPLGAVTLLLAGTSGWAQRQPGARYCGLAGLAFLGGVTTLALQHHGVLPVNGFTTHAVLMGSALEMALLFLALADHTHAARREHAVAQAQALSESAMVLALQQSQARYRAVIEHVGEGMVVVQNEQVVFVNFRATEILEATKADILEGGFVNRLHPDDRAALSLRMQQRLLGLDPAEPRQVRLELPHKPMKWLEFGDNIVPWDGGQGLLVFFLDVTARHNAELETRAAVERQQKLNALRTRFIAMTSHEFRTPLATILSAQELLQSYGERLPPDEKTELFGMIRSGVSRMTGMLERILLLGQAEAHMLEFRPQWLDLAALCYDLVLKAKSLQPDSLCVVLSECAPGLDRQWCDAILLRHIFGNLLSNAIKYSPSGGEVRLKVWAEQAHTVFEVSDQGIGIPDDELGDLFESFQRASNVGAIPGTGLGLAIAKQSVDLHGGTLQVRSRAGQGSCFTVRLAALEPSGAVSGFADTP
ncbi:MAG: ATP-binding protein [Pseudomonadota bacterium]